jgi:aspartyl-tRNA(Asn)/glutamyl-tRNA(Gln) amidotransferase subunit B
MDYIPTIGIEVHVELKTKHKAFSDTLNTYGNLANSVSNEIDMGYPGTLPTLNKEIFDIGIRCAKVLNCKINKKTSFDRKIYFYPDNSKNYQITQKNYPIGYDGYVEISNKKIFIEEMHLEEDTAKSFHDGKESLLDFNRAGIPLIEIVSKPNIDNEDEAVEYVLKLREILSYAEISDVKIEEGSLRCDVNISLRKNIDDPLGTKVEVKNIGSINSIKLAIRSEIERQRLILNSGEKIIEQTMRYSEEENKTILMRVKESKNDYRYFPEPDIPNIYIDDNWINSIEMPVLPDDLRKKYINYGINDIAINALILYKDLNIFLNKTIELGANPIICANLLTGDILSYLNKENISIYDSKLEELKLKELSDKIEQGIISSKMAKIIIPILLSSEKNINEIIEEENLVQIKDVSEIQNIVNKIFDDNKTFIDENKNNPQKVEKYLMGQIMKETKGKVDPSLTIKLLKERL